MAPYELGELPETTTWIGSLTAEQARAQCVKLELQPAGTLEAMRAQLREFVKRKSGGKASDTVESPEMSPQQLIREMGQANSRAIAESLAAVGQIVAQASADRASIPQFVRDMIRDLPKTDGIPVESALVFLKKTGELIDLDLASPSAILMNVTPHTSGTFREFWLSNIGGEAPWLPLLDKFQTEYLKPHELRLAQERHIHRLQRDGEPLNGFVSDIESMFTILNRQATQGEVFSTIFRGINAESRITMAGRPQISDLAQLKQQGVFAASLRRDEPRPAATPQAVAASPGVQAQDRPRQSNQAPNSDFQRKPFSSRHRGPGQYSGRAAYQPRYQTNYQPAQWQARYQQAGYRPRGTDDQWSRPRNSGNSSHGPSFDTPHRNGQPAYSTREPRVRPMHPRFDRQAEN